MKFPRVVLSGDRPHYAVHQILVLIVLLMTGTAHAGVIVGTAYCTGIEVADCAMDGGVLTDVNGTCFCDTTPSAPPSDDERAIITSPTTFPWYTAVKVDIGATGRGSAMLISDCTMLTVGHVVFVPGSGTWLDIEEVHPGHYYNSHSAPFSGMLKQFRQSPLKRVEAELSMDYVIRHNHLFL